MSFQRREFLEETATGTELEHCFNWKSGLIWEQSDSALIPILDAADLLRLQGKEVCIVCGFSHNDNTVKLT